MILSPVLNACTAEPVVAISPAKSDPMMDDRGLNKPVNSRIMNGLPESTWQSVLFTVVACTLISTSSSLGIGTSISFMERSPGKPYEERTAAFMHQLMAWNDQGLPATMNLRIDFGKNYIRFGTCPAHFILQISIPPYCQQEWVTGPPIDSKDHGE